MDCFPLQAEILGISVVVVIAVFRAHCSLEAQCLAGKKHTTLLWVARYGARIQESDNSDA